MCIINILNGWAGSDGRTLLGRASAEAQGLPPYHQHYQGGTFKQQGESQTLEIW